MFIKVAENWLTNCSANDCDTLGNHLFVWNNYISWEGEQHHGQL